MDLLIILHSKFYIMTESFFVWMSKTYRGMLEAFMRVRWVSFIIILLSALAIYYFGGNLQSELAPQEDRSAMRITATGPEGTTFDFMDFYINRMIEQVKELAPEVITLVSVTSPGFGGSSSNSGFIRILLSDPNERERTQSQIAQQLSAAAKGLNDARAIVIQEQLLWHRLLSAAAKGLNDARAIVPG